MINLEVEATNIASIIDKPLDFPLKRRIINSIIRAGNTLLRQSIVKNKTVPVEVIQSFVTKVEKVQPFSTYFVDGYKAVMRTTDTMPNPLRYNSDYPFETVSAGIGGGITFANSDINTVRFNSKGLFTGKVGRYVYINERIYLYHNSPVNVGAPTILVRGVFENPLDVVDYSGQFRYSEENYPISADLITTIKDMIRRGELAIEPEDKTVDIDNDK